MPIFALNYKISQMKKSLFILFTLLSYSGFSQITEYSFSQSIGTYTPISGGTSMELLSTATSPFDGQFFHNSPDGLNGTTVAGTYNAFPIGFNFFYDGQSFDGFFIGTDGWIKLGSTTGSLINNPFSSPISSTTVNTNNLLAAFGNDTRGCLAGVGARVAGSDIFTLTGTSTAVAPFVVPGMRIVSTGIPDNTTVISVIGNEITMSAAATTSSTFTAANFVEPDNMSFITTGAPGSQVLTVQYKNLQRWTAYGDVLNFQIKLYEGTNVIEFVYSMTASPTVTNQNTAQVGLKGALSPNVFNNRTGTANDAWTTSVAGTLASSNLPFRGPASTLGETDVPSGLTFAWAPPACLTASNISFTNILNTSFTANWDESPSLPTGGYNWELRTEGLPGSGPVGLTASGSVASGITTVNISGLTSATIYQFYLQSDCGVDGTSNWTNASQIITLCDFPTVASTTPNIRCGEGTTDLSATVSAGTAAWYDAAIGGNQLGQGLSFTTPVITETTSFFVEAREADNFTGGAKLAPTLTTATTGTNWGLVFDLTSAITLNTVDVYLNGAAAGNVTVELRDNTGALLQTTTVAVPAGVPGAPIQHTIPIGFDIEPGNGYRLVSGAGNVSLVRETSGNTYPYPLATAGAVVSGFITNPGSASYYWFYNWDFDVVCASPRTEVIATVSAPPALTLSSNTETICENDATDIVTISSVLANYDVYTWDPAAGITGNEISGYAFNPNETTTFVLTAEQTSGALCAATTQVTVTVNPNPSAISVNVSPSSVCEGSIVTLNSVGGTLPFEGQIGTGTLSNITSTPFKKNWGGVKTEAIYSAADLTAMGMQAGDVISSIGWVSSTTNANVNVFNNFSINVGWITESEITVGFNESANIEVYPTGVFTINTIAIDAPIDFALPTPITWDGTSNLLVATCFNNSDNGAGQPSIGVRSTSVPSNLNRQFTADNNPNVCSSTTSTNSTSRPNLRVEFNSPSVITWSPIANLFMDANATMPYNAGDDASTVYYAALTAGTVNVDVLSTTGVGCTAENSVSFEILANSSSSITESVCGSYTAPDGAVYTTSGVYTAVIPNAAGCDSTITINLTIIPNTLVTLNPVICEGDSYLSPAGNNYTASGTYTETVQPTQGCPVEFTINLTVNETSSSETTVTECDSYTWNGTTYTMSGTYTLEGLTNANGCDSTATLVLTINNSFESTEEVTACDEYTWSNGVSYIESGTYIQELQTGAGCDSTLTLVLTINASSTNEVEVTACDQFTWNDMTYTESGEYTQVFDNAAGCDSTVTLMLTINNSSSSSVAAEACGSYTWDVTGMTYTESGMYTATLENAAGCDSIITLDLTINNFSVLAINNGNATLTASAGVSFQWVTCPTFAPIAGETNQLFTTEENGNYAVIATDANGCVDTSACVSIVNVGLEGFEANSIAIYPNPTEDFVVIDFSAAAATVEILDAQGKLIRTMNIVSGDQVSLKNEQSAVYFVRIITENATTVHRIVKQ